MLHSSILNAKNNDEIKSLYTNMYECFLFRKEKIMKKSLLCMLCFLSFLTTFVGCKKRKITGIEVTNHELVVLKGKELTGLKVNTIFDDESKGDLIDVTAKMISGYNKDQTGNQEVKITHEGQEFKYTIFVADKIIANATELRDALKSQNDGEALALKSGTYDMDRDETTTYQDQTGFYFLLTANRLYLKGMGKVVIKSSVESPNTAWANQNLVTIAGNETTIDGIDFQCKKEPNKVIEILGKNTTLKNVNIEPMDATKYAGSIYLSTPEGNTILENVNLKYGRISTTGAAGSTLTLKNVTIDFAGAHLDETTNEASYWGFDNSRSKIKVTATDSKIFVSKEFKASENYKNFADQVPTGLSIVEK